ncbi:MAG: 50S ribosomal protein L22 [Planctomycetes bacterium]|nr:50S ribosomal protein L22 [Planctomycetota bacterium]
MEFRACHKFARISARKARLVIDLVRGRRVNDALRELRFIHRRARPMIEKVIKSAVANATQVGGVEVENLVVAQAFCDEGPTFKRWCPRSMGRAYPILKRTSHITVVLRETETEEKGGTPARRRKAGTRAKAGADSKRPAADAAADAGASDGEES